MIHCYYAYTDLIQNRNLDGFIARLSSRARSKLEGLKRREDQDLLILSYILLSKLLQEFTSNNFELSEIQYTEAGRPYFKDSSFDFTISHSDNCVAVALAENRSIGIDIEKIVEVDFSDFTTVFSRNEWDKIEASADRNGTFYSYWTLLESVLKADGRGLPLLSSNAISMQNDQVFIDGTAWFSQHLYYDPTIACCLSSNKELKDIHIQQIEII